jgi:MtN3 and saliva related transmembrane protein
LARPFFGRSDLKPADWIGWCSSAILLATLARQVVTQWRTRSVQGVSRWLFIGQLSASTGFLAYSWLVRNWVFVVTNAALLVTAIAGEIIYVRNAARRTGDER